jgi:hypothetical protein
MVTFNEADIRRSIEAGSLGRGRQVHAKGLVIDADVNSGETVITGRVRGSEPKPYRQLITLKAGAPGTAIHGVCSCPMTINCKHVAAVLIEALRSALGGGNASPEQKDERRPLLSPRLMGWLDDLGSAAAGEEEDDYPADIKNRLIYVLDVEMASRDGAARATISPVTATLLKAGGFGASPKFYNPNNIYNYQPAKYLRPVDMEILRELAWLARQNSGSLGHSIALPGEPSSAKLLSKILDTGRCRHGGVHGPVLREGRARPASAHWLLQKNGQQRLIFEAAEGDAARPFESVLPIAPPYYVDMEAGLVGPIACNLPDRMAHRLAAAPEIAPVEAAAFAGVLGHRLAAAGLGGRLPLPSAPLKTETRHLKPAPRLHLFLADARLKLNYSWYSRDERHQGRFPLPLARVSFDYGGEIVPAGAPDDMVQRLADCELVLIPRDRKAEDSAFKRLEKLDLRDVKSTPLDVHKEHEGSLFISPGGGLNPYEFLAKFDDQNRFLAFSAERIPELVSVGWQIDYSEDYPYRIAEGEAPWWADIGEGSGIDWFSFELGVEFEGHRVNLIPDLTNLLAALPAELAGLALSRDPGGEAAIEKHGDKAAQAFLSGRLKPFMLRRTKEEVAKELPPKTEIVEHVHLEGTQRDLYETVRSLMHQRVREEIAKKGLAKSHIVFLDALLKLRQICCDPRLLKMPQAQKVKRSAKLERLMEMLPEMVSEGRRILIFSQFTSMLALIEAELRKVNIPFVTLTGDTKDRASPVKAFHSGKAPLFLLSLKAGGTGLNLTAADTVIHYDPWWNPAVENQATDRAYRIGQDKPVFVYKLMVEEGIWQAGTRRRQS